MNRSPEAANAILCELPILQAESDVHFASIKEDLRCFPATDVAACLSRHAVQAEVYEWNPEPSVERAFKEAVLELGASTIIMGGAGIRECRI